MPYLVDRRLFEKITRDSLHTWFGITFELTYSKYANIVAQICKFDAEIKEIGKFFPDKTYPVQLDLVYGRKDDVITVFEITYGDKIDVEVIRNVDQKLAKLAHHPLFENRTVERGLIYRGKPSPAIMKLNYIHHLVSYEMIFQASESSPFTNQSI